MSTLVPDGSADSPWPTRQVRLLPAAGAARCSRQNVKRRVRSFADANGTCVARRLQFGKQPPRSHQATQNSWPASLVGGRLSRRIGLVPPGRTVMLPNSASGDGLSIRAIGTRLASVVIDDTPVRAEDTELASVVLVSTVRETPPPPRVGSKYPSGSGTQLLEYWNVPRRRSLTRVRKSGRSTPVYPSTTLVPTCWRYS